MDESFLLATLRLDATDATKHARCGPNARCRRDAIARVDDDLDQWLATRSVDLPDVQATSASAKPREAVLRPMIGPSAT